MKIFSILLLGSLLFASNYELMIESIEKNELKRAINVVRLDAITGNTKAMYNLSILYLANNDVKKAETWLTKCSKKNFKRADFVLGLLTLEESLSNSSLKRAQKYFMNSFQTASSQAFIRVIDDYLSKNKQASNQDFLEVASWYYKDKKFHNNYMLAIRILTRAGERGCISCMSEIGNIYLEKRPTRTFYSDALYSVEKAVEAQDVEAMGIAGDVYINGPLMLRNIKLGHEYLSFAYKGGDKSAGALLAKSYLMASLKSAYPEAINILRNSTTACITNDVYAYAYKTGRGVVRDRDKMNFYADAYAQCKNQKLRDNLPLVIY